MRKILFWVFFAVVLCTCFNLNVLSSCPFSQDVSQSVLFQTSGGTSGTSPTTSGAAAGPVMTTFIIVDGPGAGTQLNTTTDSTTGMVNAGPADNSFTMAEGHVGGIGVGEGMNCPGPLGHYHGTLRGQSDPDPEKCGWGHVAELKDTSNGVMDISGSVMKEISIISKIEQEPPDYDGAANAADEAAMDLSMLQDDIRDPSITMIGPGMAMAISEKLGMAIKDDKFVVMTLVPLPTKRDTDKDTAINLKINNALMAKQEALMILQEAEAMAAAMAAMGR